MDERLVVYPDGASRRMPAAEAEAFAASRGLQVLPIAWDGAKQGPGGPYLAIDLHATKPAPSRALNVWGRFF